MSSQRFSAVDCPLCLHPNMWREFASCPGCLGGKKISHFKRAVLFAKFPELARVDTEREMKAVRPEDES